jgi:hypothetical protein
MNKLLLFKQTKFNWSITYYTTILLVLLFSNTVNAQNQVVQSFTTTTGTSLGTEWAANTNYNINDYVYYNDNGSIKLYKAAAIGSSSTSFTPSGGADVTSGILFIYQGILGSTTQSWICPTGVTSVEVECWGAGGAGGSVAAANSTTNRTAGGGGAGSYVKKTITVNPGTTYNVIVGQGGYKGQTTAAGGYYGNRGGRSEFSGGVITSLVASGGTGGTGSGIDNPGNNPGGVLGGVYGFHITGNRINSYTSAVVSLSGGGFTSPATAVKGSGGTPSYIAASNQGQGYTSNPTVSFSGGSGLSFYSFINPNINSTGIGITTIPGSNGSNSTNVASGDGGANAQGETGGTAGTGTNQGGYVGTSATNVGAGGGGGFSIWTSGTSSSAAGGSGANGKVVITFTAPITTYTYTGTGNLHEVSNWKDSNNNSPVNFTEDFQIFKILNSVSTTAAWTVSGAASKIILGNSTSSAATLTVANGFPITGTLDITAAVSGSNSLILEDPSTYPVFGSLDSSSEVHMRAANSSPIPPATTFVPPIIGPASPPFTTFGKLYLENNIILTAVYPIIIQNYLQINSGSALTINSSSYLYLNSNATATIAGSVKSSRASGMFAFNIATPNTNNPAIQFQSIETVGASLILTGSTIEYSRDTSGTAQVITPRNDYTNVTISGVNNVKTLSGNTTVSGILTVNGSGTSSFNTGVNNLTLGSNASAVFGPGAVLNITGGSTDFGDRPVTLQSTSAGTARIGTISGTLNNATNVTVERFIPAKRAWRALTSPLKGTTSNSIFNNWQNNGNPNLTGVGVELWSSTGGNGMVSGPSNSILQYNNSGATEVWDAVTNTNSTNLFDANINNPFMVFVTGSYGSNSIASTIPAANTTLKATGQLIIGDKSYTTTANKYTFIGNPYASPLDLSLMLNTLSNATASFGGNVWVWDAKGLGQNGLGAFNLYDNSVQTYSNVTTPPVTNDISTAAATQIQSGQAFFVKSTDSANFIIKESHKGTAVSNNNVFRSGTAELFRVGLYKQVNNEWSGRDGAMTVILSDANANQSPNKMVNSTENIAFTKNGASFASNHHLPLVSSDVLNVKVWNTTVGANYKLKINTEAFTATNLSATLEDLFTNSRTPLNLEGTAVEYPFTVTNEALSSGDRFRIVFQNAVLGNNNPTENGFSIVPNPVTGDSFQVNLGALAIGTYSYSICNSLGQEIEKGSIQNATQNNNYDVKMSNVATGIYIMKIKGSDNSVFTAKIIKK